MKIPPPIKAFWFRLIVFYSLPEIAKTHPDLVSKELAPYFRDKIAKIVIMGPVLVYAALVSLGYIWMGLVIIYELLIGWLI